MATQAINEAIVDEVPSNPAPIGMAANDDGFTLDELRTMQDAINYSLALSGEHQLSAKLGRHIKEKQNKPINEANIQTTTNRPWAAAAVTWAAWLAVTWAAWLAVVTWAVWLAAVVTWAAWAVQTSPPSSSERRLTRSAMLLRSSSRPGGV